MSDIFTKNNYHISGGRLLKELLKIRPQECECCHFTQWLNQPIKLQVHHIDGDNTNNLVENLQLLCPNCHSYTDSWCKNKNKKIVTDAELIQALSISKTIHQALILVGLNTSGTHYNRAKRLILENKISLISLTEEELNKQQPHYCIDCGTLLQTNSKRCTRCANIAQQKVKRPNRENLKNLIRNKPFTVIGNIFGVSDNAIRKWCISENLPSKKSEIKKYSDEEWNKI